ncbi:MAG: ATP-binding protein [Elusimicrobia bacterium]|nr:ATP-binding protein [Elusimicrobiota bacterium]
MSGVRGVGKTTILLQLVRRLLSSKELVSDSKQIVYLSLDKKILKRVPWRIWFSLYEHHFKPRSTDTIYFLLDEVHFSEDWAAEIRTLLSEKPHYRFIVTGSASSTIETELKKLGARRWISLHVPALSFYEYVWLFEHGVADAVNNSCPGSLESLRSPGVFGAFLQHLDGLTPGFEKYLLHGGFPEMARNPHLPTVHQLMNDDIVDKALYRDMQRSFKGDILERLFLYLCAHPGCLLDKSKVGNELGVKRQTIASYVSALRAANLVYTVGNIQKVSGKKALKAKDKVYIADASLRNAIMTRGPRLFEIPDELGHVVETSVADHLVWHARSEALRLGYWREKEDCEVDFLLSSLEDLVTLVEVKYRQDPGGITEGMRRWNTQSKVTANFLITRYKQDAIIQDGSRWGVRAPVIFIPAPLFLYVLGRIQWQQYQEGFTKEPMRTSSEEILQVQPEPSTSAGELEVVQHLQDVPPSPPSKKEEPYGS